MESSLNIMNKCRILVEDSSGNILREYEFCNITCNAGRASVLARISDSGNTDKLGVAQYIAIGTSDTAALVTDTALGAEIYRSAIDYTKTVITGTSMKIYARFATGFAATIKEGGVFVDASATATAGTGNLLCHSIFSSPIVKTSADAVTVEWTIALNNAT